MANTLQRIGIKPLDIDRIKPSGVTDEDITKGGSKIMLLGKPGCFAAGTMVKTKSGSVKIEDVKPGDVLLGDDNTHRTVRDLCRGTELMYTIQSAGCVDYTVNAKHIMTVYDCLIGKVVDIPLMDLLHIYTIEQRNKVYCIDPRISSIRIEGKHVFHKKLKVVLKSVGAYYGVTIDGNRRFQLEDGTVVHNTGKCLGLDTPVMMHNGNVKMVQNIKVGDVVMGDDFSQRHVKNLSKGVTEDMYQVTMTDERGRVSGLYTCNENHILTVFHKNKIVDMKVTDCYFKLQDHYFTYPSVPVCKKDDLMGITAFDYSNINTNSNFIAKAFTDKGPHYHLKEKKFTYYTVDYKTALDLYTKMRVSGLNPFIAEQGTSPTNKAGMYTVEWQPVSNKFVRPMGQKDTFDAMVCEIFDRKRVSDKKARYATHHIKIEKIGRADYFGFEVDGNHRFLLGDYTVTHNSTILKSLMYEKRDLFPVGAVWSGTEDTNHFFEKFMPKMFIYNRFDMKQFGQALNRQKTARQLLPPPSNPFGLYVIDDCNDDTTIFKSVGKHNKPMAAAFKNGRHFAKLLIITQQYPMDVHASFRANLDGVFILQEAFTSVRKKIFDNYVKSIDSFDVFCSLLDTLPKYTALYVDNLSNSTDITESVFYYKGVDVPNDWKFGCPEYWKFDEVRRDPNYVEELDLF